MKPPIKPPVPELTDEQLAARVKQIPQLKSDLETHRKVFAIESEIHAHKAQIFAIKEQEVHQLNLISGLLALKKSSATR